MPALNLCQKLLEEITEVLPGCQSVNAGAGTQCE